MTDAKTPTRRTGSAASRKMWTDEERAAMREGARERKTAPRAGSPEERERGELDVQAKIAAMPDHDRALGKRVHELVLASAPDLVPKMYYGMPAYAKDGKVICFFKPASKFKVRYATFEFQADARLDDGAMWPVSFALTELTAAEEALIQALVKKAVS